MISNQVLIVLLGISGLGLFCAPEAWRLVISMFKRSEKPQNVEYHDTVAMLSSVIDLRRYLSDDPKALEAIDTVLTPSIVRRDGAKRDEP